MHACMMYACMMHARRKARASPWSVLEVVGSRAALAVGGEGDEHGTQQRLRAHAREHRVLERLRSVGEGTAAIADALAAAAGHACSTCNRHTFARACARTHTHAWARTRTPTHARTHTNTRTHEHTHTHSHSHTHSHTHTHARARARDPGEEAPAIARPCVTARAEHSLAAVRGAKRRMRMRMRHGGCGAVRCDTAVRGSAWQGMRRIRDGLRWDCATGANLARDGQRRRDRPPWPRAYRLRSDGTTGVARFTAGEVRPGTGPAQAAHRQRTGRTCRCRCWGACTQVHTHTHTRTHAHTHTHARTHKVCTGASTIDGSESSLGVSIGSAASSWRTRSSTYLQRLRGGRLAWDEPQRCVPQLSVPVFSRSLLRIGCGVERLGWGTQLYIVHCQVGSAHGGFRWV
jgi:hypothetical protein